MKTIKLTDKLPAFTLKIQNDDLGLGCLVNYSARNMANNTGCQFHLRHLHHYSGHYWRRRHVNIKSNRLITAWPVKRNLFASNWGWRHREPFDLLNHQTAQVVEWQRHTCSFLLDTKPLWYWGKWKSGPTSKRDPRPRDRPTGRCPLHRFEATG